MGRGKQTQQSAAIGRQGASNAGKLEEQLAAERFRAQLETPKVNRDNVVSAIDTGDGIWLVVELRADDGSVRRNLLEADDNDLASIHHAYETVTL